MLTGESHITEFCELPVRTRALLVTPLLLLALAAPVHADPLFSAPFLSFDTGINPRSVAIADLNGDGRPDLVVANYGSSTVSVLLGSARSWIQAAGTNQRGDYGRPG